jgi:hypothetical protein
MTGRGRRQLPEVVATKCDAERQNTPPFAMTLMRGPMTRVEIRRARGVNDTAPPEPAPEEAPINGAIKASGPFATPARE